MFSVTSWVCFLKRIKLINISIFVLYTFSRQKFSLHDEKRFQSWIKNSISTDKQGKSTAKIHWIRSIHIIHTTSSQMYFSHFFISSDSTRKSRTHHISHFPFMRYTAWFFLKHVDSTKNKQSKFFWGFRKNIRNENKSVFETKVFCVTQYITNVLFSRLVRVLRKSAL